MSKRLTLSTLIVVSFVLVFSYAALGKWDRSREGDPEDSFRSVYFINENKGWAVGDGGLLVSTNNGGAKWDKVILEDVRESKTGELYKEADLFVGLWGVYFINDKIGWISGDVFKGRGVILYTEDGGKTWKHQSSGVSVPLYAIYFLDARNGWAAGENGMLIGTQSGGTKWDSLLTGKAGAAIGEGAPGLWGVRFINLRKGWVAGSNGTIKMTQDGGKTWVDQKSNTENNLSGLDFVNENTGWAVGEEGVILNTTDGGKTWTAQNSGVTEWLWGVKFISEKEGLVVGEYGTILHTTDGGKTWQIDINRQKGAPNTTFRSVSFPKPGVAYAASESGLIFKYKP